VAPPPALPESTKRWLVVAGSVALAVVIFAVGVASMRGNGEQLSEADGAPSAPPSSTPAPEESVLFAPLPAASVPVIVDAGDVVLAAVKSCLETNNLECARAALEPAVAAKAPSAFHVQLLYDLCELEGDHPCMSQIAKQHPKVDRRPKRERLLSLPGLADAAVASPETGSGDQARRLMVTDKAGARTLLETRVFGMTASRLEADLLWTICHEENDRACCATVDTLYPHLTHTAH